jgi:hypothetical protein
MREGVHVRGVHVGGSACGRECMCEGVHVWVNASARSCASARKLFPASTTLTIPSSVLCNKYFSEFRVLLCILTSKDDVKVHTAGPVEYSSSRNGVLDPPCYRPFGGGEGAGCIGVYLSILRVGPPNAASSLANHKTNKNLYPYK